MLVTRTSLLVVYHKANGQVSENRFPDGHYQMNFTNKQKDAVYSTKLSLLVAQLKNTQDEIKDLLGSDNFTQDRWHKSNSCAGEIGVSS